MSLFHSAVYVLTQVCFFSSLNLLLIIHLSSVSGILYNSLSLDVITVKLVVFDGIMLSWLFICYLIGLTVSGVISLLAFFF